jgi:hypothetical protein
MALNYSKWDSIDCSDDEVDDTDNAEAIARKDPKSAGVLLAQHEAMMRLVGWLSEAAPDLPDPEMAHVVRFIATQDKVVCPDSVKRHAAVAKFMTEEPCPGGGVWVPPVEALVALAHLAERRTNADGIEADEKIAGGRVLLLVMGALNTLQACEVEGGPVVLAETLEREPMGEMAERYTAFEYAKALVQRSDGGVPATALLGRGVGGGGAEDDDDDQVTEELLEALEAVPSQKKSGKPKVNLKDKAAVEAAGEVYIPPPRRTRTDAPQHNPWLATLKGVMKHGGIVLTAMAARMLYNHWQGVSREAAS